MEYANISGGNMSIKMMDLAWVAGFLEGEGSFCLLAGVAPRVTAVQVEPEPLLKLVNLFGGSIYPKKTAGYGKKPVNYWNLGGAHGAALMMTLYPMMSSKRKEQIHKALSVWKSKGAKFGEHHYRVKVDDHDMLAAMRRVQAGESLTAVARELGVSHSAFSMSMNGLSRPELMKSLTDGHITRRTRTYGQSHYNVTVNDEEALTAMRRVQTGESMYSVAKSLDLDPNTVSFWMRGLKRPYLLARLLAEPIVEESVQGVLL
jgi:transposase-like protein